MTLDSCIWFFTPIQKPRPDSVPEGLDIDRDSDVEVTGEIKAKAETKPEARTARVRELLKYYEAPTECPEEVSLRIPFSYWLYYMN